MKQLFFALCWALALTTWHPATAWAGDVPREPILRIETGMHTSQIWSVASDSAGRYLATGSQDKTVRVWEVATGALLQTLRPPIGPGNEGAVFAVAMSPDGKTIACAGQTGHAWDNAVSIYLFSRTTGKLFRRIEGLLSAPLHLRFSRDGQFLAAGMSGTDGVRLYRTDDYRMIGHDTTFSQKCTGLDFGPAVLNQPIRLAVSSFTSHNDNFVRLYEIHPDSDTPLRMVKDRRKVVEVGEPAQVSFTADGSRLAVGFNDSARIKVLSGTDLSEQYAPDVNGLGQSNLKAVSWSADGQTLYATGEGVISGRVLKWTTAGRGQRTLIEAASDTIRQLIPVQNGAVFVSAAPSFGILGADDKARTTAAQRADYRGLLEKLQVSQDGAVVQFAYEYEGKSPARFSIRERRLTEGITARDAVTTVPPQTTTLPLTAWMNSRDAKLGGVSLKMDEDEVSRSLAIAPDRQSFVLGTGWYVRRFDATGKPLWKVSVPVDVWAVNISSDGKVVVAAIGDGTLRWYRMSDGQELCSFFPAADRKRWVLWTPSGYYDTSVGGEELIGWHINRRPDTAADFFPVSRFRSTYYRPDVMAQVLPALDEVAALLIADDAAGRTDAHPPITKVLPPVVTIVSPSGGSDVTAGQIKLRYTVRTPSGEPVTSVKILVDGRPVETTRDFQLVAADDTMREATVNVPSRNCTVSVIAYNRFAASEPATVPLHWKGPATPEIVKPRLFVLAIGISKYPDPTWELDFAAKDAHDFQTLFKGQTGSMYSDVVIKSLTDAEATRAAIVDGLQWIQKSSTSKDVAMVFLSGHGCNDTDGTFYYVPIDIDKTNIKKSGVPSAVFRQGVEQIPGKVLFFLDSCHSGNVLGNQPLDTTGAVNELASAENGIVVYTAAEGRQVALEDEAWQNGAFTKSLIDGVKGKADFFQNGKITVASLEVYIAQSVQTLTQGNQTPTTCKPKTMPDFIVALKK